MAFHTTKQTLLILIIQTFSIIIKTKLATTKRTFYALDLVISLYHFDLIKRLLKEVKLRHGFSSVGTLFQRLADPINTIAIVYRVLLIAFYDEVEVIFIIVSRSIARVVAA